MFYPLSSKFESWITKLRLPWMNTKGKGMMGGFAAVLGDAMVDWATASIYEHYPEFASAQSIALIASERQLTQGLFENPAEFATRLTTAVSAWQLASRALGLLIALHYLGYDDVVIAQANGRYFQLSLPLDPANPTASLVIGTLTPNTRISNHPWWSHDNRLDFASRFTIIFTSPPAQWAITSSAPFTGAENVVTANWSRPLTSSPYVVMPGIINTDPSNIEIGLSNATASSIDVSPSDYFNGSVHLLAYEPTKHPFVNPSAQQLNALLTTIRLWRAAKATPWKVICIVQGRAWGWPKNNWGDGWYWGPNDVVKLFDWQDTPNGA